MPGHCLPGPTCRTVGITAVSTVSIWRGTHALKCEVGPTREGRNDSLRDFTAAFHPRVSGHVTPELAFLRKLVSTWPLGMLLAAAKSLSTLV